MTLKLLLFQIVILLSSTGNILAQPPELLQSNSSSSFCRNVTILFPFGIRADCHYIQGWLEMAANASHRPILDFRRQNEAIKEYAGLESPYIFFSKTRSVCGIAAIVCNDLACMAYHPTDFVIRRGQRQLPGIIALENPQNVQEIIQVPDLVADPGKYNHPRENLRRIIRHSKRKIPVNNISGNAIFAGSSSSWRNSELEFVPYEFIGRQGWARFLQRSSGNLDSESGLSFIGFGKLEWESTYLMLLDIYLHDTVFDISIPYTEGLSFSTGSESLSVQTFCGLFIVASACSLGVIFISIGRWLCIIIKKRKVIKLKEKFFKRNGGLLLQQMLNTSDGFVLDRCKMFNSKELDKATNNFNVNRILGQGGQGTVYKGILEDGRIIAVKKSKVVDEEKLEEFINELVILSQINHRNVVKLLGCCLETEVPLLVYEFVPNGTLFQYLHDQNDQFRPTWEMRLRIATEVAGALSYLHSAAAIPIYHRDIKSTNILLDEKCRAKVADFGTSKFIAIDQTHVTTKILGTLGYLDPEYYQSSQLTDKSDVYSFGVVLVELLTGKKPIFSTTSQENISLAAYYVHFMKRNRLHDILDDQVTELLGKKNDQIMAFANLARRCLDPNGKKRPTMEEISMELKGIRALKKKRSTMFSEIMKRLSFKEIK